MTKQRKAQIITTVLLAGALGVAAGRKANWTFQNLLPGHVASEAGPQDAVYAMLDAARDGDVTKYMAACTGQMEASLRQSIRESSEDAFRQSLRNGSASLKGVAVMEPERINEREVKLRIEYVYEDRSEGQTMYLEKVSGAWRVSRVETAERVKTVVPYGTPAQ